MADAAPAPTSRSRFLAGLPGQTYGRLLPRLEPVALVVGQTIVAAGERPAYVYFPLDCVLSLLSGARDGMMVEAVSIGREGLTGLSVVLGGGEAPWTIVCDVPGAAVRLAAPELIALVEEEAPLRERLQRYAQAVLFQAGQNAVCNALHAVPQRCARWLLLSRDQAGRNTFAITQEGLSRMLGVRRATVSTTLAALRRRGALHYDRGMVTILDGPELEASTCPCYRLITNEYDRVLG